MSIEPGPPADASYQADGDRWTLVFVRDLPHAPQQVWAALTDPAQLSEWAPFVADRDLATTGPATLTMVDGDTATDLPAAVSRVEPPSLLEYSWGEDLLRWELADTGSGTRLTLRHTMDDRDGLARTAAGWHLCLAVADHLLAGHPVGPIRGRGRAQPRLGRAARRVRQEAGRSAGTPAVASAQARRRSCGQSWAQVARRSAQNQTGVPCSSLSRSTPLSTRVTSTGAEPPAPGSPGRTRRRRPCSRSRAAAPSRGSCCARCRPQAGRARGRSGRPPRPARSCG